MEKIMRKVIIFSLLSTLVFSFFFVTAAWAVMPIKLAHPNVPATPMGRAYELFKEDLISWNQQRHLTIHKIENVKN